jgi:hypothetical protein
MNAVPTSPTPDAVGLLWPRTKRSPQYLTDADVAALEEALSRGYLGFSLRHPHQAKACKPPVAYRDWQAFCRRQQRPLVYVRRYDLVWWADVTLATDAIADGLGSGPGRRWLDETGYAKARRIALGGFAAWVEDPNTVADCRGPSNYTWRDCVPVVSPHYVSLSVPQGEADLMARTLLDLCAEHLEDAPVN